MMRALLTGLCLLATLATAKADPLPAAISLLTNGGFETGNFDGWSLSGDTEYAQVFSQPWDGLSARGGQDYALLGPRGADGILSQTFTDTPGDLLTVSFWLASDGGTPSDFSASLDGVTIMHLADAGPFGWVRFQATATATGSDTLQFTFRDDTDYFALDRVHAIQAPQAAAAIPEPPTAALLTACLVILTLAANAGTRPGRRTATHPVA